MNQSLNETTYTPLHDTTRTTEPLKSIVSNGTWDILCWHIWGVISVSVSIVLLWLNFAEIAMGGTLGRNSDDTANILGALQLLIQMHALSISASLFQIARQWVLGSLLTLNRGIPLGLVGAERQMGLPSFVISHGYLSAAKYSVSLWWGPQTRAEIRRKWDVGLLTAFLFVSCILSVLAGPASGVLMIPRVYWFLDSTNDYNVFVDGENTYPYIMVPLQLYYRNPHISPHSLFFNPFNWVMETRTSEYWQQISSIGQQFSPTTELLTSHQVPTADEITFVNTTTTWGRKMDDGPAAGSSYAQLVMSEDSTLAMKALVTRKIFTETTAVAAYHDAMRRWSQRQYVMTDATAVVTQVNCQYRQKVSCPPTMDRRTAPWCLEGSARHLILLSQTYLAKSTPPWKDVVLGISRAYITEGSKSEIHPQFTDSLQIVLDDSVIPLPNRSGYNSSSSQLERLLPSTKAIVCSISTVITPAIMSSFTTRMDGKFVHCPFHNNSTVQYHADWLHHTSALSGWTATPPIITTFPARSMVDLVGNVALRLLGTTVNIIDPWKPETDPAWLEITIAGAFASIFSTLRRSTSQYAIEREFELPANITLEPRLENPGITGFTIEVYNQGYGFRLSSAVGVFAVALLILHGLIVMVGSLWQLFWERSVIEAWSTVPEYLALGLGSTLDDGILNNTCAGITAGQSLQTIVNVGVTSPDHLELQVGGTGLKPVLGRFDAKYGSCAKRRHRGRNAGTDLAESTESM